MLKNIPYSVLMQDKRAYEIMLLRDQYNNTFINIAKEFEISAARAIQIYRRQKFRQKSLYINHVSIALGHKNTTQIRKIYDEAYECYQDTAYACAYMEKKYKNILAEYRAREPGMPAQFFKNMPPFKPRLSTKTISRIVEMREDESASFVTIGKELDITRAKAKRTYEMFYHKQALEIIKDMQEKATSYEEKRAIFDYWFRQYKSPKERFDMLMKEQAIND